MTKPTEITSARGPLSLGVKDLREAPLNASPSLGMLSSPAVLTLIERLS